MPPSSFTPNDLTCIGTDTGNASRECHLVSVHEPTDVATWIENNWDNSLVVSIRNNACGPLACMLSPEEPALAIFGDYRNRVIFDVCKSLVDSSGFPVIIRSACDNPALTLLTRDTEPHDGYAQFSSSGSGNGEEGEGRRDVYDQDPPPSGDTSVDPSDGHGGDDGRSSVESDGTGSEGGQQHKPNRHGGAQSPSDGGGGGGDGGGAPTTEDSGKWEGPLHRIRIKLQLKLDAAHAYSVTIGCTSKVNWVFRLRYLEANFVVHAHSQNGNTH
ncbi:hypothetical protein C8R45DRAFT_510513 [Mycena sanguinolenta]|nr:hypothetical protein C8R45DRAFT_510513 [Mycena sanguinolenta]